MTALSQGKLANILADPQAGIYLIDKPKGEHSFAAISVLRKILGMKKIGFAGTLDPLASGLLILATGAATKLLDFFHQLPKTYQAEILFGQTSDTYDLAGQITINSAAKEFLTADLQAALQKFHGVQQQQPPIYSAKKIQGQKAHQLARRGSVVTLPVCQIEIYELTVEQFQFPVLKIKIKCSAGTYIRSLAHDLGQAMGTGAVLIGLRRTDIGPFTVGQAQKLEQANQKTLAAAKINPQSVMKFLDLSARP